MNLTIERKQLLEKLKQAGRVAVKSATLPILSTVLLSATEGTLTVTASDLDVALTVHLVCETEEAGRLAVCCSRLSAALGRMDGESVRLRLVKRVLHVECGGDVARLMVLPAEDFPEVSKVKKPVWTAEVSGLGAAFKTVSVACSTDVTRYVLNGIFLDGGNGRAVATDGRRLLACSVATDEACAAIVPLKAAGLVTALAMGPVSVKATETAMEFSGPAWMVVSKLIEGNYPNYQQVIPAASGRTLEVSTARLLRAVGFAESVLPSNVECVRLVATEADRLSVQASGPEIGEAESVLDAEVEKGWSAAFNGGFFCDMLGAFTADSVSLDMKDEMSPCVVRHGGVTAVLMPVRVS